MTYNIVIILFFLIGMISFAFYKREMLIKMFSIDVKSSANQFQQQLENTADLVIKRLEEQIIHLEDLLERANEKIVSLDQKIQEAKDVLVTEMPPQITASHKIIEQPPLVSLDENVTLSSDSEKESPRRDKPNIIIELADLGYDISEISKATGISQGEIILLLQLNKK